MATRATTEDQVGCVSTLPRGTQNPFLNFVAGLYNELRNHLNFQRRLRYDFKVSWPRSWDHFCDPNRSKIDKMQHLRKICLQPLPYEMLVVAPSRRSKIEIISLHCVLKLKRYGPDMSPIKLTLEAQIANRKLNKLEFSMCLHTRIFGTSKRCSSKTNHKPNHKPTNRRWDHCNCQDRAQAKLEPCWTNESFNPTPKVTI